MSDGQNALDFLEQLEDTKNIKKIMLFFVSVVILGVVGFCEVLYVAMILPAFPDGLVQGVAIVGACATGASAILLLVGKLHWFSKGPQSVAAWVFVGVETVILVLNVLLAVQLHNGHVDSWISAWANFYPAAPIVAFVGWGVILFLDKTNKMRTMHRDQGDRQEKAELTYEHMAFQAQMRVKHESLKILEGMLAEKIRSAPNMAALEHVADQITDGILGQISGQHITSIKPTDPPALPGRAVSMAQNGTSFPLGQRLTPEQQEEQYDMTLRAMVRSEQARLRDPWPIDPDDNPEVEKMLRQAVARGQATEEEVRPLLAALRTERSNHQSNGHQK